MYTREEAIDLIPVSKYTDNTITINKMKVYFWTYIKFVWDNNREEEKPMKWYRVFKYVGE